MSMNMGKAFLSVKQIIKLFILLCLLHAPAFAISVSWPALIEASDFVGHKENSQEFLKYKPILNKLSEEDLRRKIMDSYYFVNDFESSTREEKPKNWKNYDKKLNTLLGMGEPQEIVRPKINVFFPVYPMSRMHYFKGDEQYISEVNICQDFLNQKRYKETSDCYIKLQNKLAAGTVEHTRVQQLQLDILHGFLILHLIMIKKYDVDVFTTSLVKRDGNKLGKESIDKDFLGLSRALFAKAIGGSGEDTYFPKKGTKIDETLFFSFYNYPNYFDNYNHVDGEKYSFELSEEHIDPMTWVQAVMPFVFQNTIAMSQNLGIWHRAFQGADKFERYLQQLNFDFIPPSESPFFTKKSPVLTEALFLRPTTIVDTLAMNDYFRARASQYALDPQKALQYIAAGLSKKPNPELSSLLFAAAAESYFDLDILRLAKRSFSWSEMVSKSFTEKYPSIVFFGAESAFWSGQFDIAEKGFERFLQITGDSEYSPYARLRLAEVLEHRGMHDSARSIYEYLVRNFDRHKVFKRSQVNLFCLDVENLLPHVRKVEYEKVVKAIEDARSQLKEQAKTCLLKADLSFHTEKTKEIQKTSAAKKNEDIKKLKKHVAEQKELIKKFKDEFTNSKFLELFQDRLQDLELVDSVILAELNRCQDLLEYYVKNKDNLIVLSKRNDKFIQGLKWDTSERTKVLKCSALLGEMDLWTEARTFDIGHEAEDLQKPLFELSKNNSVHWAFQLYLQIKESRDIFAKTIRFFENSRTEIIDNKFFWQMIAMRTFMVKTLQMTRNSRDLLQNTMLTNALNNTDLIFENKFYCGLALEQSKNFTADEWDILVKQKTAQEWLKFEESLSQKTNKNSSCQKVLWERILTTSMTLFSPLRDRLILVPFLQRKGIKNAPEEWLFYVSRLEIGKNISSEKLKEYYVSLAENSGNLTVEESAKAWLRKHFPKRSDTILW